MSSGDVDIDGGGMDGDAGVVGFGGREGGGGRGKCLGFVRWVRVEFMGECGGDGVA